MSADARVADVYRKMTATPADCVRTSQAGTKLDRTQTAAGLLRFVMKNRIENTACTRSRTNAFDAIRMTTLLELVVFWHRRYGRMPIDPVLCGLLEP